MNKIRGAFIVFEGCDKAGKTTQSKRLVDYLNKKGVNTIHMHFPIRETQIGKLINDYLTEKQHLDNHVIHLLFSANRWEMESDIRQKLMSGTTIVCDRYAYSGVAYTAAKGLNYEWCKNPDEGLPKPDLVVFLKLRTENQMQRPGFGEEVYEKAAFQSKVLDIYEKLKDENWEVIDVNNKSIEKVHENIKEITDKMLNDIEEKPLANLW